MIIKQLLLCLDNQVVLDFTDPRVSVEDMADQVLMDSQVPRETEVSMEIRVQREREDRQAAAPDQEDQDLRVIPDVKGLPVHQDLKASPADPDKMDYQDQKVRTQCF